MPIATITSKGQLTIPKSVRDRLRLQAGDRVVIEVDSSGSARMFPISKKVADVFGFFAAKAVTGRSPSEMKRGVARAFKQRKL